MVVQTNTYTKKPQEVDQEVEKEFFLLTYDVIFSAMWFQIDELL